MREGYFAERGIYYRVSELIDNRQTLVFLHGLSGNSTAWRPFEENFEASCNILTVDLRGHGKSKRLARIEDYEVPLFAEDLALLLVHLRIRSYVLIAHSFGAVVALELLVRSGAAVGAVLLAPDVGLARLWRTKLTGWLLAISVHLPIAPRRVSGSPMDYGNFRNSPDWDLYRIWCGLREMGLMNYFQCLHQAYRYRGDDRWRRITIPILLIHGTRDSYIPYDYGVQLSGVIPHAKLTTLNKANHMLPFNNIPEIERELRLFLAHLQKR